MPREGPEQAQRRRTVNGISKKWKIARRSKHPRGLVNPRNTCYRHGVLQPLLHLPRFVNWIKKHNPRGTHWPCRRDDPNLGFPSELLTQDILQDEIRKAERKNAKSESEGDDDLYRGCVPCLLKRLVTAYWGNIDIGGQPHFTPQPFPHQHDAIFPLHKLTERWFCVSPPGHLETQDRTTRTARRENMTDQQDADEFARHIFAGIESSYDRS
jgi:hypothetical protein